MEASVDPIPECRRCRELEQVIARLEVRVRELEEKLAAALRQGKRQAAPFRREGGPKHHPQPPGRKSGDAHGPHAHRAIPRAQDVSETSLQGTQGNPDLGSEPSGPAGLGPVQNRAGLA